MPNWTSNTIRAEGPEAATRAFLDNIKGNDELLDFNRVIPMPPILHDTATVGRSFDGRKVTGWYVIDPDKAFDDPRFAENERPFTTDEEGVLSDIEYADWYGWSIANWGTKWNACHAAIEIAFVTAWNAPHPVYRKLAEMFPNIAFAFTWSENEPDLTHTLSCPFEAVMAFASVDD